MSLPAFRGRAVLPIALALLCLWPIVAGFAGEQGASNHEPAPAPATSPVRKAIPLSEIATRSAETAGFMHAVNARLPPDPAVEGILTKLPSIRLDADLMFDETKEILGTEPTLDQLQVKQRYWKGRQVLVGGWLRTLTERASQVKTLLDQLVEKQKIWMTTREAARDSNAPTQILQQIEAVLSSLGAVRIPLEVQLKDALDLQAAVALELSRCDSMSFQIALAQQRVVSGFLTRDAPPVWSRELWGQLGKILSDDVPRVLEGCRREARHFVLNELREVLVHVGLFFVWVILFSAVRRKVSRHEAGEEITGLGFDVFHYPWAAAYVVSTIAATGPLSSVPESVKSWLKLIAFLPMVQLAAPLGPRAVLGGCLAGVLFALETIRYTFSGVPFVEQILLIAEAVSGITVLVCLKAQAYFGPVAQHSEQTAFHRLFRLGGSLMLAGLVSGFLLGALGYMRLARVFTSASVDLGFLVLLLYSSTRILTGLAVLGLNSWPIVNLRMVQHHRVLLMRGVQRALVVLAIGAGLIRSLDSLGLFQPTMDVGRALLTARFERGVFSLSLGDLLAFVLAVWLAFLISAFIRFVLQEDVYPRLGVPVGLSYAASSLLHYIILALGWVAGLAVLGVDPTKVTVLAGALGVGIGFGLQGMVNNFVAGLILLFERPIHVGDSIDVGENQGEVRRIGMRASTIRSRQGAEIIIPNAQLVTERVTNWTLSDQLRRIDLPVGVNYGAPPRDVISMLEGVAHAHPRVLSSPSPQGFLVGFGDSSMNFELRAWTDEFADWALIRSELALAVHDAVAEAGWYFPFPQHDVRVLNPTGSQDTPAESPIPSSGRRE